MTTLFASDLDRTLIYSRKAATLGTVGPARDAVCVEVHDGKQASFVTTSAASQIAVLAATGRLVPVTTRIEEQYRRVHLPGPPPPYAITTNGAQLLVDGRPDRGWDKRVDDRLRDVVPLDEDIWTHVGLVSSPEFTVKLRNAADRFCYAVVRPHHLPDGFVDDIAGWAAERGWRTSLQGRKLYWVPEALTKAAAVIEVAERLGAQRVLAAGDSLLDVDMLLAAERGLHPRHGELFEQGWSAPRVQTTGAAGIAAGEEIVGWFAAYNAE